MFDLAVGLMRTRFLWLIVSFESEQCNVWFDHPKKKRNLDIFLPDIIDLEDDAPSKSLSWSENLEGRSKKVSNVEESLDCLKNVKLAEEDLPVEFNHAMEFLNKVKESPIRPRYGTADYFLEPIFRQIRSLLCIARDTAVLSTKLGTYREY